MEIIPSLLWFLLPVAAASGWLMANSKQRRRFHKSNIPLEYIRAFNFLIDKKHDKAVDAFMDLFQIDSDAFEIHIILGNLFRQRGEIEEAISLHQKVLKRRDLSDYQRASALLELGRDYLNVGLLDRAEKLLQKVVSQHITSLRLEANQQLLTLYESERDWTNAIKVAKRLIKLLPDENYNTNIAHYYCELTELAIENGESTKAKQYLMRARSFDNSLLRADVLLGGINLQQGKHLEALSCYEKAFASHPDFAALILPNMERVLSNVSAQKFSEYIQKLKPSITSISYLKAYIRSLLKADLRKEADKLCLHLIENEKIPISVLRLLLQHKLENNEVNDEELVQKIVKSLSGNEETHLSYQCSHCGFQSRDNYWHCPGCGLWDTLMPTDVMNARLSELWRGKKSHEDSVVVQPD